jgi:hypothetical protein
MVLNSTVYGPYSPSVLATNSILGYIHLSPYTVYYQKPKDGNCTTLAHSATTDVPLVIYLAHDSYIQKKFLKMESQINVTASCNVTFQYQTVLAQPPFGVIDLYVQGDTIYIENTYNKLAPLRVFDYIFNVTSTFPTFGLHAVNFTRFFVKLKCDYDLQTLQEFDLGTYKSGNPTIQLPINDLVKYTFHICNPDSYQLEKISGYLYSNSMVQIQKLDPLKPDLTLTVFS